jgi:hypothetical protein|tara:strand:+ start:284 stop:538 length:255 start_codon:yes stop_codon:yes gene_type:complete
MSDGNPISQMPPWGWGLLLLGGGGGIGAISGVGIEKHEECVEKEELLRAEAKVEATQTSLDSMQQSMSALIKVLKDCQSSPWVE